MKTTLIATVLNEEATVGAYLDSIFSQTLLPDEVIIVDGGSRDKTVSNIKHKVLSMKRIRFKVIEKRGNRSVGRNEAINHSSAEIIAISDAGCVLDRDWFKNITKPFENSEVDVVAGYYKGLAKSIFEKCLIPYVLVMPDRVDPGNFLPATRSMAIRKSIWKKVGGFDAQLSNNEDYAFANKLKKMGANIKFAKNAIIYWLPRANLGQAFTMFFRFALGDAEAGILRPKVLLVFARHAVAIYLLFTNNPARGGVNYLLLTILFIAYLVWAIYKNYKYVKDPMAFFYLPLIQLTADFAVIVGTTMGLIKRISTP